MENKPNIIAVSSDPKCVWVTALTLHEYKHICHSPLYKNEAKTQQQRTQTAEDLCGEAEAGADTDDDDEL